MYTLSKNCPSNDHQAANGKGLVHAKALASEAQMYHHARMFSQITVNPGCSIGYHTHEHETEFYYILKGEAVFSDNGKEVILHSGDVTSTGGGEGHSLENRTGEPVELIALIIRE